MHIKCNTNRAISTIETLDKKLIVAGLVLGFTANTEQLCFVSLFMYRIKHRRM